MLVAAGFDVLDDRIFPEARSVLDFDRQNAALKLLTHWAANDPFGDLAQGEPNFLLLRGARAVQRDAAGHRIDGLLDIACRRAKRAQFALQEHPRIGLNIHHTQDFMIFRPIMDVLQRAQVVGLMRTRRASLIRPV